MRKEIGIRIRDQADIEGERNKNALYTLGALAVTTALIIANDQIPLDYVIGTVGFLTTAIFLCKTIEYNKSLR